MIIILIVIEACLAAGAQLFLRHGAMHLEHDLFSPAIFLEPLKNISILSGIVLLS